MPVFRYFVCVGAVLLTALLMFGDNGGSQAERASESGTATDSLRSMAHHGEPKDTSNIRTAVYRKP